MDHISPISRDSIFCAFISIFAVQESSGDALAAEGRHLLQDRQARSAAAASITVVNTASQLQQAILRQAQDIEIRSHLDTSIVGLVAGYNISFPPTPLGAVNGTRSIRVRL